MKRYVLVEIESDEPEDSWAYEVTSALREALNGGDPVEFRVAVVRPWRPDIDVMFLRGEWS